MEKGTLARSLMDFLSAERLRWNKMPGNFERFVYPGLTFEVPSDPDEYRKRLIKRFPAEQRALRRYFVDIRRVQGWNVQGFVSSFMPRFLATWGSLGRRLGRAKQRRPPRRTSRDGFTRPCCEPSWQASGVTTVCPRRGARSPSMRPLSATTFTGPGSRKADPRALPVPSNGA